MSNLEYKNYTDLNDLIVNFGIYEVARSFNYFSYPNFKNYILNLIKNANNLELEFITGYKNFLDILNILLKIEHCLELTNDKLSDNLKNVVIHASSGATLLDQNFECEFLINTEFEKCTIDNLTELLLEYNSLNKIKKDSENMIMKENKSLIDPELSNEQSIFVKIDNMSKKRKCVSTGDSNTISINNNKKIKLQNFNSSTSKNYPQTSSITTNSINVSKNINLSEWLNSHNNDRDINQSPIIHNHVKLNNRSKSHLKFMPSSNNRWTNYKWKNYKKNKDTEKIKVVKYPNMGRFVNHGPTKSNSVKKSGKIEANQIEFKNSIPNTCKSNVRRVNKKYETKENDIDNLLSDHLIKSKKFRNINQICHNYRNIILIKFGDGASNIPNSLSECLSELVNNIKKCTLNDNQLKFLQICYESQIIPNFISNAFKAEAKVYLDVRTKKCVNATLRSILKCNIEKKIIDSKNYNLKIQELLIKINNFKTCKQKILDYLFDFSMILSIKNFMIHKKKFNYLIKNSIHKCTFDNLQIHLSDNKITLNDKNIVNRCNKDHFRYKMYEYMINAIQSFILSDDSNNYNILNEIIKYENKKPNIEDNLSKMNPSCSLPIIKAKNKFLNEIELNVERAFYGLRWNEKIKKNANNGVYETLNTPFDNKRSTLPDKLNNDYEYRLRILKRDIMSVYRNLNLKRDQNKNQLEITKDIRNYCKKNDLIIIQSDKTKRNMIISIDEYKRMGKTFLNNNKDYSKLEKSNSAKIEKLCNKKLVELSNKIKLNKNDLMKCKIQNSHPAEFFFNIKDHKKRNEEGLYPIRPIASVHNTPVDGIDFILQKILTQASSIVPSNIRDADEAIGFFNELNNQNMIDKNSKIISLDVVNLYPSIPLDKGLDFTKKFLQEHEDEIDFLGLDIKDVLDLLKIISTNYEIIFNNEVFLQKNGVPMGARFAPPYAIIFMYELEKQIMSQINTNELEITLYKRYIDDILFIYKDCSVNKKWNYDTILNHFNKECKKIKFTIETPNENGYIPFLDSMIKLEKNKIMYKWYQKELHSGNLIHFDSQLPISNKKNYAINTFRTLLKRNNCITELNKSIKFVCNQLWDNGFPDNIITDCLKIAMFAGPKIDNNNNKNKNDSYKTCIKLPYINENINSKVQKMIRKNNINIKLINTKDNEPKKLGNKIENKSCTGCSLCNLFNIKNYCLTHKVIYDIECQLCKNHYIGRTMRPLHNRIKEHLADWKNIESKGALGHHMKNSHNLDTVSLNLIKIKILDHSRNTPDNIIKEAFSILKNKPELNRKFECTSSEYIS